MVPSGSSRREIFSRKGFCRNPRGIFPTEFPGEFRRGFFGGFFRPVFPWKKQDEKIHAKIHGNFQIRIWEFRGQNPHCKDPALNLSCNGTLHRTSVGACAMTTKFLDNIISTFKILLSWRFHEKKKKNSVFGRFSSLPPRPPPLKSEHFIFIVVSPSLSIGGCALRGSHLQFF